MHRSLRGPVANLPPDFDTFVARTGATIHFGGDRESYSSSRADICMPALVNLRRHAHLDRQTYYMSPSMMPPFSVEPSTSSIPHQVGDMVYFWTGRCSHGYASIRGFKGDHVLLDPVKDATKGSDYRARLTNPNGDWWAPRDRGVLLRQIDTPPQFWWENF